MTSNKDIAAKGKSLVELEEDFMWQLFIVQFSWYYYRGAACPFSIAMACCYVVSWMWCNWHTKRFTSHSPQSSNLVELCNFRQVHFLTIYPSKVCCNMRLTVFVLKIHGLRACNSLKIIDGSLVHGIRLLNASIHPCIYSCMSKWIRVIYLVSYFGCNFFFSFFEGSRLNLIEYICVWSTFWLPTLSERCFMCRLPPRCISYEDLYNCVV
jgi:hypothetical protein